MTKFNELKQEQKIMETIGDILNTNLTEAQTLPYVDALAKRLKLSGEGSSKTINGRLGYVEVTHEGDAITFYWDFTEYWPSTSEQQFEVRIENDWKNMASEINDVINNYEKFTKEIKGLLAKTR